MLLHKQQQVLSILSRSLSIVLRTSNYIWMFSVAYHTWLTVWWAYFLTSLL